MSDSPAQTDRASGRVALISGAAGAIGGAIAEALAVEGARVVGLDARPLAGLGEAEGPHFGEELAPGPWAGWITGDVGDDDAVAKTVQAVAENLGRLDVVVHAAGIARDAVLWKMEPDEFEQVLRVNLTGAFLLLHHAVPLMRAGREGRIVLIGSINGSRGKFGLTAYAASKAGLLGLAKSAAREVGRFGITVNVVEPGMVDTPMTAQLPAEIKQQALDETLTGRIATPGDVAASVSFLCSGGGEHITGQLLRVDGGQYL